MACECEEKNLAGALLWSGSGAGMRVSWWRGLAGLKQGASGPSYQLTQTWGQAGEAGEGREARDEA